ncbi:MAG: hypothetical protein ACRDFY_08015 [Candidatus Limnocylindria bacterium]
MNRLTAMRVIAWFLIVGGVGFSIFTVAFGFVGPNQQIHAVHNAVVASLISVLTVPPLVAVARRPDRAGPALLILATLALVGLATMALSLTPDPFTLPVVVLIGALWFLAPSRDGGLPAGRPSLVMLALALAGAVLLGLYGLDQAALQRTDQTSDHARFFHWVETSFYAAGIVALGLLGAWRPRALRLATWCAGVALAALGAASVVFAAFPSALPSPWGWAALIGGVAFIGLGGWEVRRLTRPDD